MVPTVATAAATLTAAAAAAAGLTWGPGCKGPECVGRGTTAAGALQGSTASEDLQLDINNNKATLL
jgi:hypothetical protein